MIREIREKEESLELKKENFTEETHSINIHRQFKVFKINHTYTEIA